MLVPWFSFALPLETAPEIRTHFKNLMEISCDETATQCFAVGMVEDKVTRNYIVYKSEDAGLTWKKNKTLFHEQPPFDAMFGYALMHIECDTSGTLCHITGTSQMLQLSLVFTTEDAGHHWTKHILPRENYTSLSTEAMACSAAGERCLVIGGWGQVYSTQDKGHTWLKLNNLPSATTLDNWEVDAMSDLHCSDSGLICTLVGGASYFTSQGYVAKPVTFRTQDGGYTWSGPVALTKENNTAQIDYFSHVRCDRSGLQCIALRYQEKFKNYVIETAVSAYVTSNGGDSWKERGAIDNAAGDIYEPFHTLNCDDDGLRCLAISSPAGVEDSETLAYMSINGGARWSKTWLKVPVGASVLDAFCDKNMSVCQAVGMIF